MSKNKFRREDLYTIIIWYKNDLGNMKPAKYHNCECDKPGSWKRAKTYFKNKFPTVQYCNIYGGITHQYKRREYF